jgi:hypothetical protein
MWPRSSAGRVWCARQRFPPPGNSGSFLRPPPVAHRRDRRRADGAARCAEGARIHHLYSAGHQFRRQAAGSGARRPRSVAAPTGGRRPIMRGVTGQPRAVGLAAATAPFSCSRRAAWALRRRDRRRADGAARRRGRRAQERRRAATSPGCRRAACTPVAQLQRAILPAPVLGGITRFAPSDAARGPPSRRRSPSPRPPACGWGCAAGRRAPASMIGAGLAGGGRALFFAGTPTRSPRARGAVAPSDTLLRGGRVGRHFNVFEEAGPIG